MNRLSQRFAGVALILSLALALGAEDAKPSVDPYPLTTDALTGEPLGDKPVTYAHEKRELRFAKAENLEQFKKDPAAALKKVDQQIIDQQSKTYPLTTCAVTKEKLGSMGEPVKMVYGNHLVQLCCAGCKKEAEKKGAEIIAKIDAAAVEQQKAGYPLKTCLVTDEELGDEPSNLVFNGRLVRFCCSGCVADFKKEPAKYLAKLDAAAPKK